MGRENRKLDPAPALTSINMAVPKSSALPHIENRRILDGTLSNCFGSSLPPNSLSTQFPNIPLTGPRLQTTAPRLLCLRQPKRGFHLYMFGSE